MKLKLPPAIAAYCSWLWAEQVKLKIVTAGVYNIKFSLQARRKSEELKTELSDSSKRNSVAADSGSKRSSLFSPENSDGGESSPRKLSLKSSAQAVRLLNKGRNLVSICQEFKNTVSYSRSVYTQKNT